MTASVVVALLTALIIGPLSGYVVRALLPPSPSRRTISIVLGIIAAAIAGVIVVGACTPKTPPNSILVRVQSSSDDLPITGAEVTLELPAPHAPLREHTDSNGYARFEVPITTLNAPGRIVARAPGFQQQELNIDITAQPSVRVLELTPNDQSAAPVLPPSVAAPPNQLPATAPDSGPTSVPTPTELPPIFDGFPVCIDTRLWARTRSITPVPSSERPYCVQLQATPSIPYAFGDNDSLIVSALMPWQDGLTLRQTSGCQFRDVAAVITSFEIEGRAWIGLIVDHPQRSPGVISVWLGRFDAPEDPIQVIMNETESPVSASVKRVLLSPPASVALPLVLGVRFDGRKAFPSAASTAEAASTEMIAAGLPWTFSLRYWVGERSNISLSVEAVHVTWEPDACGLPHPGTLE